MGSFRGQRIPDYSHWWEEEEYKDMPDYWHWYHLGYQDGLLDNYAKNAKEGLEKVHQENEALKALLAANIRVLKEELRKEFESQSPPKT